MRLVLKGVVFANLFIFLGEAAYITIGTSAKLVLLMGLYNSIVLVLVALFLNKLLVDLYSIAYNRGKETGFRHGRNLGFNEGKQIGIESVEKAYDEKLDNLLEKSYNEGIDAGMELVRRLETEQQLATSNTLERWWKE